MTDTPADPLDHGEYGVIIRKGGIVDLLVPPETTHKPIRKRHRALIGAVLALANDPEFAKLCEQRYRIEMTAAGSA